MALEYVIGDLIYGLGDARGKLAVHLKVKRDDKNNPWTIDGYGLIEGDPSVTKVLKYDPKFIESLKRNSKYKKVVGEEMNWDNKSDLKSGDDELKNKPVEAAAIAKRKCKGGLDWILNKTTRRIHFCLDGIIMEQVTRKSFIPTRASAPSAIRDFPQGKAEEENADWKNKVRSITGSELRWLYRNRNESGVRTRLQFWLKNEAVKPPWDAPEKSKSLFVDYGNGIYPKGDDLPW